MKWLASYCCCETCWHVRCSLQGEIVMRASHNSDRAGVTVVARDDGPDIASIEQALRDGYSSSGSLGLRGLRRLVDEFEIVSKVGQGTTVTVRKWKG